jgi:hypothetical protein
MKTILAALLAGTFLVSLPLHAEEKSGDKTDKSEKSDKGKKDKNAKSEKKDDKAKSGGGW